VASAISITVAVRSAAGSPGCFPPSLRKSFSWMGYTAIAITSPRKTGTQMGSIVRQNA